MAWRQRFVWTLAVCAVSIMALLPVASQSWAWGLMNREEALRKIGSTQLEQRRQAYFRLGDVGTMEDIPLLLAALRDDEDIIRGVSEQAIWGIFMRVNDSTADPMFHVALDLAQSQRLKEAEAKFTEVIGLRPDFAEAWHRRAEVKVMADRWDDAFKDFSEALRLNPYHFGALEGMGHCRLRRDDPVAAMEYFKKALDLNPNLSDVYEALKRAQDLADGKRA